MTRRTAATGLIGLYFGLLAVVFVAGHAHAQTLAPVAAPAASAVDWWLVAPILAVGAVLVGWFLWHRKNATAANAAAATAGADLKAGFDRIVAAIERHTSATVAAAPGAAQAGATAAPAVPVPAPGKNGVAGVLSLPVTGDPKTDLAAFQAAYFS